MRLFAQTLAFDHVAVQNPRHQLIMTDDEAREVFRYLRRFSSIILDYETSGLAYYKRARICGVALGVFDEGLRAFYIPIRHLGARTQCTPEVILGMLKDILEDPNVETIAHNIKFEDHMSRADGIHIRGPRRDTMIEASLHNENYSLALKERASTDLGDPLAHYHEQVVSREIARRAKMLKMKKTEYLDLFGYAGLPIGMTAAYACYDIEFTGRLAKFYDDVGIRSYYPTVYETETKLTKALCTMEQNGVPVDVEYIHGLKKRVFAECDRLRPHIMSSLGYEFNLGSDDELRHVLTKRLGLGPQMHKRTQGGLLAVDAEVLNKLVDEAPILASVLEWRIANKIGTTYTDSILKRLDANNILHGEFKQLGTNTGRLASANPNMQNFPSDSDARALKYSGKKLKDGGIDPFSVKRAFVRRSPEHRRWHFDYSQIELRVLAFYTKDPTLTEVYRKGEDVHARTALEVFGDAEMRRPAKVINFGLSYCLSARGFARQAKMPFDEAEKYMATFFQRFPNIAPFREAFWKGMREGGNSFVNLFGRPRRIPNLKSLTPQDRTRAERQAIGSLIQGTAAELTKAAIVRMDERFESADNTLLISTIHDEVSGDTVRADFNDVIGPIKEMMEDFPEFGGQVPIVVDGEYSDDNWAEKKDIPEEWYAKR